MATSRRQRNDGTWTFTSEAWDAAWYWPVGTRISVETRDGVALGTITKTNTVSVYVQFDEMATERKVSMKALHRICEFCHTTGHDVTGCPNIDEEQLAEELALRNGGVR